jgi:hypothetical protein
VLGFFFFFFFFFNFFYETLEFVKFRAIERALGFFFEWILMRILLFVVIGIECLKVFNVMR